MRERLIANLNRLLEALAPHCEVPEHENPAAAQSASAASLLPLAHAIPKDKFTDVFRSGAVLKSRNALGLEPKEVDQMLGRVDDVCFYIGSAIFPGGDVGLLFSPQISEICPADTVATPFDSGGCVRKYPLNSESTDRIQMIRDHEMPYPENRDYLSGLLLSYFTCPEDYLNNQPYTCPTCSHTLTDPHGFATSCPDLFVRQHEVRIPGEVSLFSHLAAIIIESTLASRSDVKGHLEDLVSQGTALRTFKNTGAAMDGFSPLHERCRQYIVTELLN